MLTNLVVSDGREDVLFSASRIGFLMQCVGEKMALKNPGFLHFLGLAGCIPIIPEISGIFCVWSILR